MTSRQPLSRNVVANVVNAAASILLAAISVPLALHYVGLDGFGVWTLAQTALVYVATAETGFGPAVQRYVSVARGAGHLPSATPVVWSAAGFYFLLGGLLAAVTALAAPSIVALFDVPPDLQDDAVDMFRITGVTMLLALLASGLANVLQGMERFFAATIVTAITAVVFLVAATTLLASGQGLRGLALAALAQQLVGVVIRIGMVLDVLTAARPALVSRAEGRELLALLGPVAGQRDLDRWSTRRPTSWSSGCCPTPRRSAPSASPRRPPRPCGSYPAPRWARSWRDSRSSTARATRRFWRCSTGGWRISGCD